MSLKQDIEQEYIVAFKAKNEIAINTFRMLKTAIKNKEIALGSEADDNLITEVIAKEVKTRKESAEEFKKANRPELAQKEEAEIAILAKFLPEQLGEEKISEIVKQAITKINATGPQDMGRVMKEIMPQVKGKADGATVSKIVQSSLKNE